MSTLPERLLQAYLDTDYTALTPRGELTLRIGVLCPELDALLEACGAQEWVYITAYNPASKRRSEQVNESAQQELLAQLELEGGPVFSGMALSELGDWPPEPSLLALGVNRARAEEIGRRFGQNAVVVGGRGQAPELLQLA